jgi:hypothetical protein
LRQVEEETYLKLQKQKIRELNQQLHELYPDYKENQEDSQDVVRIKETNEVEESRNNVSTSKEFTPLQEIETCCQKSVGNLQEVEKPEQTSKSLQTYCVSLTVPNRVNED